MLSKLGAFLLIGLLWLLHFLPLAWLAALGQGLGRLLWWVAGRRRRTALRNLELCFPEKSAAERERLGREHFGWVGRSLLERGLLWFASPARLQRLMHVKGDIALAEHGGRPVMWYLPHFVGLEWVGPALMLNQKSPGVDVYQRQSNPVFDKFLLAGRSRFGQTAFVPFFGVPASTLLAPSKIARSLGLAVQPLVVTMLPGGQGYEVEACEPPAGYPSDDLEADAHTMNAWLEERIRRHPAQYLWVHRRFKTRPEGEPSLY